MRRDRHDGDIRPLTFGQALAAHVRIITWCEQRERSFEPKVADMHGEETTVIDWAKRLRCSQCGGTRRSSSVERRDDMPAQDILGDFGVLVLSPLRSRQGASPGNGRGFFGTMRFH